MDNKEYIEREFAARAKAEHDAKALLDRAAEESRDLSPEEEEQFDRLVAASARHKERIEKLERMDAARNVSPETRAVTEAASGLASSSESSWDDQLVSAIRNAFDMLRTGGAQTVEYHLPEIRAGKARFEFFETRALESVANVNVPTDFATRVALYQRTMSPWTGIASIINSNDGAPIYLPRSTSDPTTYAPGQGTAITPTDPTVTSVAATPASYKALSLISQEMAQDDAISIMDLIARQQGRSIGLHFGSVTTAAVLSAATNGGTASGTPFFTLDDLIDLTYNRAVPYRQAGSFVMATGAVSKARKLKDSDGQYLWQPSGQLGEPDRLLGYPVFEDPYLATPASATKSVLFGDMSAWVIKQLPLRVAVSTEYAFNTDSVAIKTVYRAGGALPDAAAIAYLVSANT